MASGASASVMPPPPSPLRMEGYLRKLKSEEGGGGKLGAMFARSRFNRRWFAIEEKEHASEAEAAALAPYGPLYELKYWKAQSDVGARLPSFSLDLSAVRGCGAGVGLGPYTREAFTFHVETLQRTYVLTAASDADAAWWLAGIAHYCWQHNETVRRIESAHGDGDGDADSGDFSSRSAAAAAAGVMLSPGRDSFATGTADDDAAATPAPAPAPSARRRASLPDGVQTQGPVLGLGLGLGSPASSASGSASLYGGGSPSPLPAFSPLADGGLGLSPDGGGGGDDGRVQVQVQVQLRPFGQPGAEPSPGAGLESLRHSFGNPFASARSQAQADRSARAAAMADRDDERDDDDDEIDEELEHKYDAGDEEDQSRDRRAQALPEAQAQAQSQTAPGRADPRPRPAPGELSSPIRFGHPDVETARPAPAAADSHSDPFGGSSGRADSFDSDGDDPFAPSPAAAGAAGAGASRSFSPLEALHSPHADASAPPQTERPAAAPPSAGPLPGRLLPPIRSGGGGGVGSGAAPPTNPHARTHAGAGAAAAASSFDHSDDDDPFAHARTSAGRAPAGTAPAAVAVAAAGPEEAEESFTVLMSPVSPSPSARTDMASAIASATAPAAAAATLAAHDDDDDDSHGDPFAVHGATPTRQESQQSASPVPSAAGTATASDADEEALIRSSLDSGDKDDDEDDDGAPLGSVRPAHPADDSSADVSPRGRGASGSGGGRDDLERSLDAAEESILNGSEMLAESMANFDGVAPRTFQRHPAVPQLRADTGRNNANASAPAALPPLAIGIGTAASPPPAAAAAEGAPAQQRSPQRSPVPATPLEVAAAIAIATAPAPPQPQPQATPAHSPAAAAGGFVPSNSASCCTASEFASLRSELRAYGVSRLQADLSAAGWLVAGADPDGTLRVNDAAQPFNPFARLVSGLLAAPYGDHLAAVGMHAESARFMVAQNRPELDAAWASTAPEMVGRASMGARHQFLLLRSRHWSTFNVATFGMEPARARADDLRAALALLSDMEAAAREYGRRAGWGESMGLFFHAYPLNSVHALHLHMVDLASVGPSYRALAHKNLPIAAAVEVLRAELDDEEAKARGHGLVAISMPEHERRSSHQPKRSLAPGPSPPVAQAAATATAAAAVAPSNWQSQLSSLLSHSDQLPYEDVTTARPNLAASGGANMGPAAVPPSHAAQAKSAAAPAFPAPPAPNPASSGAPRTPVPAPAPAGPMLCSCDECFGPVSAASAAQACYCWTCHTALCAGCAGGHDASVRASVPHQLEALELFLGAQSDAYCARHALPAPALALTAPLLTPAGVVRTGLRPRALRFTGLHTAYCDTCARLLCDACRAEDGVHGAPAAAAVAGAGSAHSVRPLAAQHAAHSASLRSLLRAHVLPKRAALVSELAALQGAREQSLNEAAVLRAETGRAREAAVADLRAKAGRARLDAAAVSDAAADRLRALDAIHEALQQQQQQHQHPPTTSTASMCAFLARAPALIDHAARLVQHDAHGRSGAGARDAHASATTTTDSGDVSTLLQRLQRDEQSVLSARADAAEQVNALPALQLVIAAKDRDLDAVLSSQRGVAAACAAQAHSLRALYTQAHAEIAQWMALTEAAGRRLAALQQVCTQCAVKLSPHAANGICPAAAAAHSRSHGHAQRQFLHSFVPDVEAQLASK